MTWTADMVKDPTPGTCACEHGNRPCHQALPANTSGHKDTIRRGASTEAPAVALCGPTMPNHVAMSQGRVDESTGQTVIVEATRVALCGPTMPNHVAMSQGRVDESTGRAVVVEGQVNGGIGKSLAVIGRGMNKC
jgi:hypothetical protein